MTPKLTVDVKPLPGDKPADFSGGVGEFSISSSINSTNVKTNDAVTIKLVISGTGNLKLIGDPEVKFPDDFEVYDPKVDNKFRLTSAGLSGSTGLDIKIAEFHRWYFKCSGIAGNSQIFNNLTTRRV